MNRLIVDLLSDLVGLIAIALVVVGGVIGYRYGVDAGSNLTFSAGFGALTGALAALVACGILSALVLIENHLRYIADDIDAMREAEIGSEGDLDDLERLEGIEEDHRDA